MIPTTKGQPMARRMTDEEWRAVVNAGRVTAEHLDEVEASDADRLAFEDAWGKLVAGREDGSI
jgi:hypothetical protein